MLELFLKALIGIDKVTLFSDVLSSISQAHPKLLHQVGNDYCGTARNPCEAVDKNAAATMNGILNEPNAALEVLLEVSEGRIEDVNDLVLKK